MGRTGLDLLGVAELARHFHHDVSNALAAAATAHAAGASTDGDARRRCGPGSHLPHRVQLVGRRADGVGFYDDSKATTPHAVLAALAGFPSVVLVAGGQNKGLDLAPLAEGAEHVRAVVAIGAAAGEVAAAFAGPAPGGAAASMDEAVARADDLARPGRRRAAVARRGQLRLVPQLRRAGRRLRPGGRSPTRRGATDDDERSRRRASSGPGPARRPPRPAGRPQPGGGRSKPAGAVVVPLVPRGRPGQGGIEGVERPVATPPSTRASRRPLVEPAAGGPLTPPAGRNGQLSAQSLRRAGRRAERRASRAARRASRAARRASRTARRDTRRRLVRGAAPPRSRRGWAGFRAARPRRFSACSASS